MILPTPTLTGRYVRLEALELEHVDDLVVAANESRLTYAFTVVPADRPTMGRYVEAALASRAEGISLPFVVREGGAATARIVGTTRFTAIETWTFPGPAPEPRPAAGAPDGVEIGYTWYAERVQRTALNTEAKLLLCTHAFDVWGVRRVTWKTDARNTRSREAILRLGASFDGVLRAHMPAADGTVRSTAYYSMLRSEWPSCRARLAARLDRR